MRTLLLLVPLFLASCGEGPSTQRFFPRKLGSFPPRILVSGQWQKVPHFQSRELGGSKLVQLSGAGLFSVEPEISGFAEAIRFDKIESFQWQEPPSEGCALTQVSVAKEASSPFTLSFQFWGWDRGSVDSCGALLRRAQTEKVSFLFRGVKIPGSSPAEEIQFELNPSAPAVSP